MIRRARHAINDLRAEIEPRLPRRGTLRWLWAGEHGERQSGPLDQLLGAFPFIATAWLFAWLEIYATTMDAIKEQFSCDRRPPFPRDTGCATPLRGVRCRRRYDDMGFALGKGAWCYACYFLASFPLVYWLDEPLDESNPWSKSTVRPDTTMLLSGGASRSVRDCKWSVARTVESALAAGMLGFILLDLVVQFVVVGWQ